MVTAIITTTFTGIHCWANAPMFKHAHLRNPHRHLFHVKVYIQQKHDDRDIEFLGFKDRLDQHIQLWPFDLGSRSCEMMARDLMNWIRLNYTDRYVAVEVSEDGENGARVEDMKISFC